LYEKKHPQPELERMLILDIYTMLKEVGQYKKAQQYLKKLAEKDYPGFCPSTVKEIQNNIVFLDIVQKALKEAHTPYLPYSKLMDETKQMIDQEMNEWRKSP
jgi:hypothetical protein